MNEILQSPITVNAFIITWVVFILGYECAGHNLLKLPWILKSTHKFISWMGFWHSWSMFAPTPLHSNRFVHAKAVDPKGNLLGTWKEPDWDAINYGVKYRKPGDGWARQVYGYLRGKWELFDLMRQRKNFSSVGEARQWDMPILLRQVAQGVEAEFSEKGIYADTVALYIDLDYAPYFCPKEGLKDWKTNKDVKDHLIFVYECEHNLERTFAEPDGNANPVSVPTTQELKWQEKTASGTREPGWSWQYGETNRYQQLTDNEFIDENDNKESAEENDSENDSTDNDEETYFDPELHKDEMGVTGKGDIQ